MGMDFQTVADSMAAMTCIVSVEKLDGGGHGDIRIVTGNRAYIGSIERPMQDVEMLTRKFVPNSLYTDYLPRDLNFEDFCYRSAVLKKCLHSYAHPDRFDVWFNMTFLPLEPDDGNLCYCTYTMEINTEPSSERMSNISGDIAASVLETAITLRSAKCFRLAIKTAVDDIRRLCDAEYCYILRVDSESETCELLGDSTAEGSEPRPEGYFGDDFYRVASTWKDTISGSNCLIVKDDRDMEVVAERNPAWHQSLMESNVKTVALFPLKSRNDYLGYIWATNFRSEDAARIKEILELTSFVLSSEIGNYLMMQRLRILSSRDMLTGVMNRNEMNNYVERLSSGSRTSHGHHKSGAAGEHDQNQDGAAAAQGGARDDARGDGQESVGVIFCDLNGLKRVNDSKGHSAGDELIKNAAATLEEHFGPDDVFRAGGDEFVVILTGVTEEQMQEYAAKLSETASAHGVSFAAGWSYEDDASDIRKALTQADEKMYADKLNYYDARR